MNSASGSCSTPAARLRWPGDVGVAVNVSPEQICDHSIVMIADAALRAVGRPTRFIWKTESAILASASGTVVAIERLHEVDRGSTISAPAFRRSTISAACRRKG
ncbi:MAG: hypothetical protein U1E30_03155 [Rhodoblastus sp.]